MTNDNEKPTTSKPTQKHSNLAELTSQAHKSTKTPKNNTQIQLLSTITTILLLATPTLQTAPLKTITSTYFDQKARIQTASTTDHHIVYQIQSKLYSINLFEFTPKEVLYSKATKKQNKEELQSEQDRAERQGRFSLKSQITNITELACYKSQQVCLASGNQVVISYKIDDFEGITPFFKYNYIKAKNREKISFMKLAPIEESNFFLTCLTAGEGLMRWNLEFTVRYSSLKPIGKGVPKYLTAGALEAIEDTSLAGLMFRTWYTLTIVDFVQMKLLLTWPKMKGIFAYLDRFPSECSLVVADERQVTLIGYDNGKRKLSFEVEYLVFGIQNVPRSGMTILAATQFIKIYDFSNPKNPSVDEAVYSYFDRDWIYHVSFNHRLGQIIIYGDNFVRGLSIKGGVCHPSCTKCKLGLSEYTCSSCNKSRSDKVKLSRKVVRHFDKRYPLYCMTKTPSEPPLGYVKSYLDMKWSLNNQFAKTSELKWSSTLLIFEVVLVTAFLMSLAYTIFGRCFEKFYGNSDADGVSGRGIEQQRTRTTRASVRLGGEGDEVKETERVIKMEPERAIKMEPDVVIDIGAGGEDMNGRRTSALS